MNLKAIPLDAGMLVFAAGIVAGGLVLMLIMLAGRRRDKGAADELVKIKRELEQLKDEFQLYRDSVGRHFSKTAELVHSMTESYRSVYQHLAQGAQDLCDDKVTKLVVQFGESRLVERAKEPVAGAGVSPAQTKDEVAGYIKLRKPLQVKRAMSRENGHEAAGRAPAPAATASFDKPEEARAAEVPDADPAPVQGSSAVLREMEREVQAQGSR